MRFDVNRLSVLAGLPAGKSRKLNEASNRSYHDDPSLSAEADIQHGKGQLSEKWGGNAGDQPMGGEHPGEADYTKNWLEEDGDPEGGTDEGQEPVYEIDELD